jgi:phosphatidylethanolamine/phosphatidyl-N-methylethanolamine N-methyltransferase
VAVEESTRSGRPGPTPPPAAPRRRRWDLYAPVYDRALAGSTAGARRRSISLLKLRPGERVLIVGCGTGLDFCILPEGVTALAGDLSPAMVQRARARAARIARPIDVRVMDASATGEPDASFDAAVLHLILAIVPDPAHTLAEVGRVLRPGGRAVVFDKFLPHEGRPGAGRRLLELGARAVGTSINRRLEPLVDQELFAIECQEPSLLRGQFRIALLRRR